jgi:DNA invertase Pin-like site-specific DNA recombinase
MSVYGYIRVSSAEQSAESQKNLISRFVVEKKMNIDKWIEVEMSSKKSVDKRKITELLSQVVENDVVIVSELSRLGRSIQEVLQIIKDLMQEKKCRLILVKQNLDLNPQNVLDMGNKILITIFSMLAELERDFISFRTKEGLNALKAKGVKLGKPVGCKQKTMYDKDKNRILELAKMGVPINKILTIHLNYGKYLSLKRFIDKNTTKI